MITCSRAVNFIFVCCLLFISPHTAFSEVSNVEINGYVQNGSANRYAKGNKIKHDATNKLRLGIISDISERFRFGANVNFVDYYAGTRRNLWEWVPDSVTDGLPPEDFDNHIMELEDQVYLNDLYISYDGDRFDFTMGKQQLVMGVGYAYNPLDVLNVKNIMDPAYEPSGHSGYRFDFSLGKHSALMMFYGQDSYSKDSTKLVKLDNTFDSFSFSFLIGESMWSFTDYYDMENLDENRRFVGADMKKNIYGLDIWSEVMHNWMEESGDYTEAVFGAGKSFNDRLNIVVEYYRYGLAKTDYREYDINDFFGYFYGQKKAVSRDIAFGKISYRVNEHFIPQPCITHSINDGSFKFSPNCAFPVNKNLQINLVAALPSTKQAKAYNFYCGTGFMVLGKYSF